MGVQRDLNRLGMATTLTMVVTDGRHVALGHVGDSRAYLMRGGVLRQITSDHTYVQHLIDTGQLTRRSGRRHPWRNVVLRSVDGVPDDGRIWTSSDRQGRGSGDRLLLCSDGLTDLVDDERIAEVLPAGTRTRRRRSLTDSSRSTAEVATTSPAVVRSTSSTSALVGDGLLLGAVSTRERRRPRRSRAAHSA